MQNIQNRNLENFPYEVLFNILLYAKPKDIASYCQTSKRASEICRDPDFWRAKLWKDHGKQEKVEGMTWQKQYQSGPIKVINSPISSGRNFYGIIDNQGDLYMAGYNNWGQLGDGTRRFRRNLKKVDLKSKVVSVTTGLYDKSDSHTVGVVTENGEVYFWGTRKSILTPKKLDFPRPGKIVKFVFENGSFNKGIIMDNGLAYLVNYNKGIFLIPAKAGTKIVDLLIPLDGYYYETQTACFFLDNYGNVFLFRVPNKGKNIMIKLDLPDPIRQLSISNNEGFVALSIKGEVYTWGSSLTGTESIDEISEFDGYDMTPGLTFYIYKPNIPAFVVSISSGYDNVAAVTSKGTVYVWGYNYNKRLVSDEDEVKLLSSGKMTNRDVPFGNYKFPFIELPLELKLKSKIKLISLGGVFNIALTEDGVINYWGSPGAAPENTI